MSAPESAKPVDCWYCGSKADEPCQKPFDDVPCRGVADRAAQRQPERDERAAFEDWCRSRWGRWPEAEVERLLEHDMSGSWYEAQSTNGMWSAWQARAAFASPQDRPASDEYRRANPLGGPAATFDGIADLIRAGDPVERAMRVFGVQWVQDRST